MRELSEEYVRRARRLAPLECREVKASRVADRRRRKREDMGALQSAARGGFGVVLTERGELWTTLELAAFVKSRLSEPVATWFLLGGEEGFEPQDEAWAPVRLALSRFTLPHELARVILSEQLYRALSVLQGGAYHRA